MHFQRHRGSLVSKIRAGRKNSFSPKAVLQGLMKLYKTVTDHAVIQGIVELFKAIVRKSHKVWPHLKDLKNRSLPGSWFVVLVTTAVLFELYATQKYFFPTLFSPDTTDEEPSGWWGASEEDLKFLDTKKCTIERRSIKGLKWEEFEQKYRYKKPVLLTFPLGLQSWSNPSLWTLKAFNETYGNKEIGWGSAYNIVRQGGRGSSAVKLRHFLQDIMHHNDTAIEPGYVFDREFLSSNHAFEDSFTLPFYLRIAPRADDTFLFLGGSRSGVMFHKHADAWNAVIHGRKRWFLYPGNVTPPGGYYPAYSILMWYTELYPQLKEEDKPLECIQEAGEILYLPESFYHGTLNIGDTLAVGSQKVDARTDVEKLFYKIHENSFYKRRANTEEEQVEHIQKDVDTCRKILKFWPNNTETMLRLAEHLHELGEFEESRNLSLAILDKDPHFIVAMLNLARLYEGIQKINEAESLINRALDQLPTYPDTYLQYAELLIRDQRLREVKPLVKKGVKFVNKHHPVWIRIEEFLKVLGAVEEAKEIQYVLDSTIPGYR